MSNNPNKDGDFLARRRQLLKLGAAGVPMVLTLKASATQPVHSALDCAFVIQNSVTILVDYNGKAWMGDGDIKEKNGKYKVKDIEKFQRDADYVFPDATVPERFRPDECDAGGGDDCSSGGYGDDDDGHRWSSGYGDDDSGHGDDSCDSGGGYGDDYGGRGGYGDDSGGSSNWRRGGGDDDGDDSGGGKKDSWTDCYKVYEVDRNTTITPADYLNGNGNWNLNGANGLYLVLAGKYLDTYGNDGGFPGISCLLSILNYLEMQ